MNQCSNCTYFRPTDAPGVPRGECHRYPPALRQLAQVLPPETELDSHVGVWPQVEPVDWCGEWHK